MRGFVTVIGLLTLAQWVFVGLLYGFIHFQDKDSPETLAKLRDLPVVGGYFPKVKLISEAEKERDRSDELRTRRIEAQRLYDLPAAWDAEEFEGLSQSLSEKGESLDKLARELEQRRLEIEAMMAEIGRRETALVVAQARLDDKAASILKEQQEVQATRSALENTIDEVETQSYKRIAKLLAGIEARGAQERLMAAPENETIKERNVRFDEAARILTFMDVEQAGQIITSMTPTDAALVIERMKSLSTGR